MLGAPPHPLPRAPRWLEVWEERAGAWATWAGPTLAPRPAIPALGVHGVGDGEERGRGGKGDERGERRAESMERGAGMKGYREAYEATKICKH